MFNRVLLLVVTVTLGLVGCAKPASDASYRAEAATVKPIQVPSDVKMQAMQTYYPLPHQPNPNAPVPSVYPPESQLAKDAAAEQAMSSQTTTTPEATPKAALTPAPQVAQNSQWARLRDGELVLVMNEKNKEAAWQDVGKALSKANIKVLDQDALMSSYYVMGEAPGHSGRAPVYRLVIESENGKILLSVKGEHGQMPTQQEVKTILSRVEQALV